MLSIQHILHSLYTYDMTYLHRYGASVVYPDAIRAYTNGSRKYSHFEHVFRDKYYYIRIYAAEGFSYHKGIEAPTKWVFAVSGAMKK